MSNLFNLKTFDFIKGAILSIIVAILTYLQQSFTDSGIISLKMIFSTSIVALIGYLIKQLMTDNNGAILSFTGGRKRRKKKPTAVNGSTFEFTESLFTVGSVVYYTSDQVSSEILVNVQSVFNGVGTQSVVFTENINYTDFESLEFEIEVD